jgi:C1A family cysteine protease
MERKYGWLPDKPDSRDYRYKAVRKFRALPDTAGVDQFAVRSYDQGNLGSCTGNAYVHAIAALTGTRGQFYSHLSRLMAYYNARLIEGTVGEDAGATIRDVVKGGNKWGVCHEELHPYDIKRFREAPSEEAYKQAEDHQLVHFYRCEDIDDIRDALANLYPVIYGFDVFKSFETEGVAKTGVVPWPGCFERLSPVGGHANVLMRYYDKQKQFKSQNSYGVGFGDNGFLWLSYKYVEKFASDFWAVTDAEL